MRHNEQNPGSDGEHDSEGEALKLCTVVGRRSGRGRGGDDDKGEGDGDGRVMNAGRRWRLAGLCGGWRGCGDEREKENLTC